MKLAIPRILHYPGSKWSMADWIISNMPEHGTYLEPYFGSGAVLFNKEPSKVETINDIDGDVVNLFRVIRERPEELAHTIHWTPYSRKEYKDSHEIANEEIEKARRFLVRCWQSIRVKTGSISGWKCRGTSDEYHHLRQWNNLPADILVVADRLKNVQIENIDATKLIDRYNRPDVLMYIDPPYVMATRKGAIYENEMSDEDHMNLIDYLLKHTGSVLLSGYDNEIYNDMLKGWMKETKLGKPVAGKQRLEVLWINPVAAEFGYKQQTLF
ncbi:DNA adenine methylase [Psychrobacillus sp. NPDC096426]|uniref:DNA adenine methylase n=1 Tax=Psychrobacillus sp. NPDC096426 TaxID=3364491 RepID=UPI00380BB4F8